MANRGPYTYNGILFRNRPCPGGRVGTGVWGVAGKAGRRVIWCKKHVHMHVHAKMILFHESEEERIKGSGGRGEFKYGIVDTL
jgi:hypothetical protein